MQLVGIQIYNLDIARIKNQRNKIEIHIFSSVTFLKKNPAVYETKWKIFVERVRPQMTIWRMRIACWIPKATNTHTQKQTQVV